MRRGRPLTLTLALALTLTLTPILTLSAVLILTLTRGPGASRATDQLFRLYRTGSTDVKWQAKRALSNLEASRALVGLRRYGAEVVPQVGEGEIAALCKHADAANVGAQREVARALANIAAADCNHQPLLDEGALALCLDLVANFAMQPQNRRSVVQAGALAPLLEQLSSDNPGVNYHAAQALLAIQ